MRAVRGQYASQHPPLTRAKQLASFRSAGLSCRGWSGDLQVCSLLHALRFESYSGIHQEKVPMPATPLPAYWERDAAQEAVQLARPMLDAALSNTSVGESGFLHVVVMNPLAQPGSCDFADAILYEESIGDPAGWDADYGAYARGKARVSWRTGLATHEVMALKPHLCRQRTVRSGAACAWTGSSSRSAAPTPGSMRPLPPPWHRCSRRWCRGAATGCARADVGMAGCPVRQLLARRASQEGVHHERAGHQHQ